MERYDCDKCGACCEGRLLVEVDEIDVLREPRLIESDPHYAGRPVDDVLDELTGDFGRCILIAGGRPCAFLAGDKTCSIHPTRPNACVAMQAGDEQCQEARAAAGLPPLPRGQEES